MIDINSSCSRVDFVQALASQLKLQAVQMTSAIPPTDAHRKLQSKLDAVDQAVKSGDPQKAEQALFEAQSAVREAQNGTGAAPVKLPTSRGVDAYA